MAKNDGLTIDCPGCGHPEWMHPEEVFAATDRFFCGECGHDLGAWGEVHASLFVAGDMLAATLARPT